MDTHTHAHTHMPTEPHAHNLVQVLRVSFISGKVYTSLQGDPGCVCSGHVIVSVIDTLSYDYTVLCALSTHKFLLYIHLFKK